jgi:AcrR family transcriptional regulator
MVAAQPFRGGGHVKTTQSSPHESLPGRRETRKAETRRELIRAGRKLFGDKGLYESRIEDLSATAGIAKGTLYTYFSDKDDLVRAVAAAGFAELTGHVTRQVRDARGESEILRRVIRAHLRFFAANPDLTRIFHQLRGMLKFDRAQWRPLRVTLADYLESLARVLAKAPRVAGMRPTDRTELASVIFGAISGVASVRAATGFPVSTTRGATVLVESLVAMATEHISLRVRETAL